MARRKLSRQQSQRIRSLQDRRRRRADHGKDTHPPDTDGIGPERHGLVIAHHGAVLTVETEDGNQVRCSARQNLGPLASGDRVVWQRIDADSGVVVARQPRQSVLARPSPHGHSRPLAANVDRLVIVNAASPDPSEYLIDRYLVAAELTGIAPVLLMNKIDLPDFESLRQLHARFAVYEQIGYPVLYTSTTTGEGLEAVKSALKGHTSVLVGQSGVGKSSLVKTLLPEESIRIGELSDGLLGRHTTTTSVLYHLPGGGDLIDSPGVRDFAVWHFEPQQIEAAFREFQPYLGQCRFSDCRHRREPDCALRAAAEQGLIQPARLESFLRILDEARERSSP